MPFLSCLLLSDVFLARALVATVVLQMGDYVVLVVIVLLDLEACNAAECICLHVLGFFVGIVTFQMDFDVLSHVLAELPA